MLTYIWIAILILITIFSIFLCKKLLEALFKSNSKNGKVITIFLIAITFVLHTVITKIICNKLTNFDNIVFEFMNNKEFEKITALMKIISSLGSEIAVGLIFICGLLILNKLHFKKVYKIFFALSISSSIILNQILKFTISKQRPYIEDILPTYGYSFPSAHAMVGICMYGYIIFLILSNHNKIRVNFNLKINKYVISTIILLIIIGMGISRIYLNKHFFTDVLAGYAIGAYILYFFIKLTNCLLSKNLTLAGRNIGILRIKGDKNES